MESKSRTARKLKRQKAFNAAVDALLSKLPPPQERQWVVDLRDHRNRIFDQQFYVDLHSELPGYFVYGVSLSGAHNAIARPRKPKVKGHNGRRVVAGWWKESQAQAVAEILSAAGVLPPNTFQQAYNQGLTKDDCCRLFLQEVEAHDD